MSPGIVAESDLTGTLKSEYLFFDGERVARKDFSGSTTSVAYYFSDHLKTTDIVTDAQGNIKNESDFYPWGGELQFLANDSNHYKFTGKERDAETGLDYFGARYYGNALGRWLTPDWAAKPVAVPYAVLGDPQSLNLYTYVRNIPTTGLDPDGHCSSTFCQIAAGVAIGTGKFLLHNTPIGGLVDSYHEWKAGPEATKAKYQAQAHAYKTLAAATVPGNYAAKAEFANMVSNAWNGMSTTQKSAVVTEGVLSVGTAVVAGKIPAPGPSLVGFSESESAMIGQSLKNLQAAGYDTKVFQQLAKSTDMPAGSFGMSLSTPPTGAALGDGAFTSQEMLDHTMEEELRHLGQDLPNQWIGRGDAAAKEAEVDANRKFPEPKKDQ